jgi:hypothetical protein
MTTDHEPDPLAAVWEFIRKPENATTISALATVAIFFSGVVFGIVSFFQWKTSKEAAQPAQDAVKIARQTLDLSNRPWLSVDIQQKSPLAFNAIGAQMSINFSLKNVGHTPALNTRYRGNIVTLPEKTFMTVELRKAGQDECVFGEFAGSLQLQSPIFPDEQPYNGAWQAATSWKEIGQWWQSESVGPKNRPRFGRFYLVACSDHQTAFTSDHHQTAYGFLLGIPQGTGTPRSKNHIMFYPRPARS